MNSVCVVIPVRDRASVLPRAVQSCLSQTRPPEEILIVDDGSLDSTPAVAARLSGSDSRIRSLRFEVSRGAQAARIEGVRSTRAEWIVFLDSDDELTPRSIEARLAVASRGEPGLVYGDAWLPKRNRLITFRRYDGFAFKEILRGLSLCGMACQMIRRSAIESSGFPDADQVGFQGQDWALTIARRHRVVHCGEVVSIRHVSADSVTRNGDLMRDGRRRLMRKYAPDVLRELGPAAYVKWKALEMRLAFESVKRRHAPTGFRAAFRSAFRVREWGNTRKEPT